MTSDFRLPPVASPPGSGPASRSADAAALALQLLRPIDAQVLPPGETARAEVVRSTAQAGQFELLLRIARADGAVPAEVKVTSRQPVAEGTQLVVQAVNQTRLLAVLQAAASTVAGTPLTRLDPAQFPADSLLQARVLTQQVLTAAGEQARFALLAKIIQGPGIGTNLSVVSSQPVEPGTLLNARVGNLGELRIAMPAEQQRQLALSMGLRDSLQRQASSEPLLTVLDRLSTSAPERLQFAVRQVLMHVTNIAQLSTEAGVAQAIKQSGLFLENNLAMLANALKTNPGGAAAATQAGNETPANVQLPPLSKLMPLLAGLATPPGIEPLPGADLKATLINLLLNVQAQLPPDSLKMLAMPPGPWQQAMGIKPGAFPLPGRVLQTMGETSDLGSLLRLTAALLSRIQHHQFQSLGQTQSFADGSSQTVWQLEIPLRDAQQFNHVQVRIQRDDPAPTARTAEPVPQWEVRLAFNLGPLGSMQAIARLFKGRVSSEFWADQPVTLRLLDRELTQLRDRLLAKGLAVGELSCHQGTPPPPRHAVQQRWIDEVT
ncbi:MAG TPA: flagellar hook-length control protein FliK [Pseudomonas xinjiangensis]|uniref:Flagellar hook-length control protein FliK n=2 Tax=root TaxID=1 RepID=A0A7V1BL65_9GAMM|nr:flagellar hook-length control protein FliK [Halopseudomonas xinjiangensis]HEC47517.1 flagellar hook-length control protein FliK [Halopseudomonas xinjiangensis]